MIRFARCFCVLPLSFLFSCNNNNSTAHIGVAKTNTRPTDSANFTQVQWTDTTVDFGTVTHGEKVHIHYSCRNVGSKPLLIYFVRPGCGCTVANYTEAPIRPGDIGEINAEFDSNHGDPGEVRKYIDVETNTTNQSPRLVFFGKVKPAPSKSTDSAQKKS